MNDESADTIGRTADRIDSLVAGFDIPMPATFHIEQLKKILPEIAADLKQVVVMETGENPWE